MLPGSFIQVFKALFYVTAHGVGAFGQKPILAKNTRGERTLPKIGKGETVLFAGNPQGALRTSDYRFTWALKYDYYAQTKRWVSSYDFSILLTAHVCMETIFRNGNIS